MTRRQKESGALVTNTLRGWRWRAQALGAALAGAMMLIASTAAAYPVCTATIQTCCRITKPGVYEVSGNLNANGGACIEIASSGATVDGGTTATLSGNLTGIGIRLLATAAGDVVFDIADISGFNTGILDDAPRSVIASTTSSYGTVEENKGNGIVIRANRVYLGNMISSVNDGNGIVVKPRYPASVVSNVYFGITEAQGNKKAGFLLDSLRSFMANTCTVGGNGTDGVDLINSAYSTIANGGSDANAGDGVKIVGGQSDIVQDESVGTGGPNGGNGLEVRNSAFDTIDGSVSYRSTGDGLLMVNGNGENIIDTGSDSSGDTGIHLKRITSSHIWDSGFYDNKGAGLWLDGSRGISVDYSSSNSNGKSNVYIGCSPAQEPDGTTCASLGLPASNGNRVTQGDFKYYSGTKPDVGIGIDKGNHHNQVLQMYATGNTKDAVDYNANCDSNQWMLNTFTTTFPVQPSCIQ